MSALTTSFVTSLLNHYFQNANHANVGDATGLRSATAAGASLCAPHRRSGRRRQSEHDRGDLHGVTRGVAARSSAGFTVSGKNVSPAAEVSFGKRTDAGSATALFWSIGTASSGAGNLILASGGIGARLVPSPPRRATSSPARGTGSSSMIASSSGSAKALRYPRELQREQPTG